MLKKLLIYSWALILGALAVVPAGAEPLMALGRMVELTPPSGYCALGETTAEREFFERYKEIAAPTGMPLQMSVPCPALKQFNGKLITGFSRWATVSVVKARGQLTLDNRTRAEFLRSLGSEKPIDLTVINDRLHAALSEKSIGVSLSSMVPIGTDGVAFYWSIRGTVQDERGLPRRTVAVAAAMLVNGLPLNVQASQHEDARNGISPATVAQRYVQAILAKN